MNYHLLILFAFLNFSCHAQDQFEFSAEQFEKEIIAYQPVQNSVISEKDFNHGSMIIKETQKAVKGNPNNFNRADYFNILSAFLTFRETEANIQTAFEKFKQAEGSCEYFIHLEKVIAENVKYDLIRSEYNQQLKKCQATYIPKKEVNLSEYCKEHNLNADLVKCVDKLNSLDQQYRNQTSEKAINQQRKLDRQNQAIVDSLYRVHQSYIGRSLVGEKYASVMWAVIQHSNLAMMEKYLPIIHKAVEAKELAVGPFKMLLDRFYGLKYGYQVFGSQNGFDFKLADKKTRKEIEQKYSLE